MIVKPASEQGRKLMASKCRHCPRPILAGQSVLYATLDPKGYEDDRFVVHTECMAGLVAEAPVGVKVTSKAAKVGRFEQIAERVALGADPFEVAQVA